MPTFVFKPHNTMNEAFILNAKPSVGSQFIAEIRDVEIQKDRMRFRRNLQRIGEILGYEISKTLEYIPGEVQTPLSVAPTFQLNDQVVLSTILRAGVPFYDGFLNVFDKADSAFVGSYRAPSNDDNIEIKMEYTSSGNLDGKVLILVDTMLATGNSFISAFEGLAKNGTPKHVHIAAAIGSKSGVAFIGGKLAVPHSIWLGALDPMLNDKAYIVPGLGDAGDLCYGPKL
jgi:uracil phosphoribosyltransferase